MIGSRSETECVRDGRNEYILSLKRLNSCFVSEPMSDPAYYFEPLLSNGVEAIWFLNRDESEIRCIHLYGRGSARIENDMNLSKAAGPDDLMEWVATCASESVTFFPDLYDSRRITTRRAPCCRPLAWTFPVMTVSGQKSRGDNDKNEKLGCFRAAAETFVEHQNAWVYGKLILLSLFQNGNEIWSSGTIPESFLNVLAFSNDPVSNLSVSNLSSAEAFSDKNNQNNRAIAGLLARRLIRKLNT